VTITWNMRRDGREKYWDIMDLEGEDVENILK
jgi:hypothetical protein